MNKMGGVYVPQKYVPKHQADATLSQNNPVSTTLYEVLPTTKNVRIISMAMTITWAVTQPTPLEIVLTIDGQTITCSQANPVSGTAYHAHTAGQVTNVFISSTANADRSFLIEGRSVRVQVRVTWAVTQPTPLVCLVKYAKW